MDVTTKPRRTQRIEPLSTEEMQKIIGKNWKYRLKKKGKWHGKEFNWWRVYYGCAWVCVTLGYTDHPVGKFFGLLGTAYLGTIGTAHVNEGWWTYT